MASDLGFELRPMVPSDAAFVFRAWLEGHWPHWAGNLVVPKGDYLTRWHVVIERILADTDTVVQVAHVEGAPDSLLGFSVYNLVRDALHWCYVKQAFRGLGVARALTGGLTACTHWSDRLPTGWRYCPQLLEVYR